ncbi:unnamed protein product [Symbiodinium sp. KB8]|nr:unnamed protein product [Symbiodinium sp. KB8]
MVCHIGADCESAVAVATGSCPTAPTERTARAAVGLNALTAAQGKTIHFHKVEAHSGCGFNDLADQLAKRVGRKGVRSSSTGPWEDFWQGISETVVDRLWLTAKHPNLSTCLPPLCEDGTWTRPNCHVRNSVAIDRFFSMAEAATAVRPITIALKIMQYNPLSLRPTGASALLARGLRAQGIHIAGFQETRLQQNGMVTMEGFWVFSSACTKAGVGGAQIWIRQDPAWQRQAFSIVHAEPQILLVLGVYKGQQVTVLSAHAPQTTKPIEELETWWQHLRTVLHRAPATCLPICCIDANATFVHDADQGTSVPKCANARLLQALLAAKDLCSNPAFFPNGEPAVSWISPQGHKKLIDYVLFPRGWQSQIKLLPSPGLGDLFADIDHKPIAVSLEVTAEFKAPPLIPALTGEDTALVGRNAVLDGFAEHFAKAERATPAPLRDITTEPAPVLPPIVLEGSEFPSIADVAHGFASLQKGRASGLSGLPCELYRTAPLELAFRYWPVVCKTVLRDCTPAQWTGGLAVAIPKPQKPDDRFAGYRSIMLLEADGKGIQKAVRPSVMNVLGNIKVADQFGGIPGCTLQLPSAIVKAHLHYLKRTKQSGALVFIDAASAYYAIARDAIALTDSQRNDAAFLGQRAALLFTDPILQEHFVKSMQKGDVAQALAATPATRILLQKHLCSTWYVTRSDASHAYFAASGTAPGAPLADAMFSLVFAGLLRETRDFLKSRGFHATVTGHNIDNPGFSPTWADDVCLLLQVACPAALAEAVSVATAYFLDLMTRHGLQANLGRGKTEALIACYGTGSAAVKRSLLTPDAPQIPFKGCHVNGSICLAEQYTHLGSIVRSDGQSLPDILHRRELARELFRPIKAKLLSNPFLYFNEKVELLRGRVLPKFLYGSGLWSLRTTRERSAAEETIFSFYRGAFRPTFGFSAQGYTNEEIAGALRLPLPSELLEVEQARVLVRLHVTGLQHVLEELSHDNVWWADATSAAHAIGLLPASAHTAGATLPGLCTDIRVLRALCRRYLKAGVRKRIPARGSLGPRQPCSSADIVLAHNPALQWHCEECGAGFISKRRLAVHRARRHGLRACHTTLAVGTACECCRVEHWTQSRLAEHLRRSAACRHVYSEADWQVSPASSTPGAHCWRPAAKSHGPQPWWATLKPG